MTTADLATFVTMRTEPPKPGEDWFRIVENKKEQSAKVYIYDEIGMWGTSAKDFAATLDALDVKTLHLHINSPGGSVFDGLAICAAIQNHDAETVAYVDGLAASAASFILQAADKRIATRNCQVMIHDAKAYAGGNAAQMLKAAELLDKTSDNIADMYAQRGVETAEEFRTRMKNEEWYTGNEALDLGLVDEVSNADDDEDAKDAKNELTKWDLKSMFRFEGRQDAPAPAAVLNQQNIVNRVEEAPHMTGTPAKTTQTPPPVQQPGEVNMLGTTNAEQADQLYASLAPFRTGNVYDLAKINAALKDATDFREEAVTTARKNFVKALAEGDTPKIAATQIEAMETFALGLSPEQFTAWSASYDAAPPVSLLNKHGQTPSEESAPTNGGGTVDRVVAEREQRIADLQAIIADHRVLGTPQEKIETKGSYKELQTLLAEKAAAEKSS